MTKKYKILGKYIKDLSSETPDVETYLYVRDNISKYQLDINITSKALKNKLIEINTTFKFLDKENNKKKSYFEIVYSTIIKPDDEVKEKKELEKIFDIFFQQISDALQDMRSIEIRSLGTFFIKEIKEKKQARNPRTGEKVNTPQKKTIHFKMSKDLFKKLNYEE